MGTIYYDPSSDIVLIGNPTYLTSSGSTLYNLIRNSGHDTTMPSLNYPSSYVYYEYAPPSNQGNQAGNNYGIATSATSLGIVTAITLWTYAIWTFNAQSSQDGGAMVIANGDGTNNISGSINLPYVATGSSPSWYSNACTWTGTPTLTSIATSTLSVFSSDDNMPMKNPLAVDEHIVYQAFLQVDFTGGINTNSNFFLLFP